MMVKGLNEVSGEYNSMDDTMTVDRKLMEMLAVKVMDDVSKSPVLELGIGLDVWTPKVVDKFGNSNVIDGSDVLIEKESKKYTNVNFIHSYFEEYTCDPIYNTIIASMVLEHVKDPILVLKKMKSWLSKNGEIHLLVPNAESIHRLHGVALGMMKVPSELSDADLRLGHHRVYMEKDLESDIKQAGLSIIARKPTYIKMLPNAKMSDYTIDQFESLFKLAKILDVKYSGHLYYVLSH